MPLSSYAYRNEMSAARPPNTAGISAAMPRPVTSAVSTRAPGQDLAVRASQHGKDTLEPGRFQP